MRIRHLLTLSLLCACRPGGAEDGQVLATMGNLTFTTKDLQSRAPRLAAAVRDELAQASHDIQKRTILTNKLLEEEALLAEAHRRGYDRQPAVVEMVLNRMLEDQVVAEDKSFPVSDADVARYYADHRNELGRPEIVRVLQIVTRDRTQAEQVLAKARAIEKSDLTAFQRLVVVSSEEPVSRLMGGDLGFFDAHSTRYPKPLVEAAFALPGLFDLSEPVATAQGFHVLKLVQRVPAYVPALADAAAGIRAKLRWLLIERKKYALGKKILRRAAPEIDIPVLAKVPLPADLFAVSAPATRPAVGP